MFRVLFFLILLLLALMGGGGGGCTCFFSGFIIFISGFRLAVSVCSYIVFSTLSPGVLLLILSAFVFNCFCFSFFSLLCLSFGELFLLFLLFLLTASAFWISVSRLLLWFCLACRWSGTIVWLWGRIWFSVVCFCFCFRPSIFFFLFSGEQVSCCLLFHCPGTRFFFCFDVFLRIWTSFFLFGGVMCLGVGSFVSCSALVLAFSIFPVCAGGISVVSATWAAGISCVLFQDWFLGLCSVLFLDLELGVYLYSELLELYLLLSSLLDGVLGLAWGLHVVSAFVSGVLNEMSIGPSACM